MAEVKYRIVAEADLAAITKTTAEVSKLDKQSKELAASSKQVNAAQAQTATALKVTASATELVNKAFSRLKSVLVGIAWGAITAAVAYLAKWIFDLATGLGKAEQAMENFKINADEARAAKLRMAEAVRDAKSALDDETAAIKRQEDVRNKELKRAKDFELAKGGTLTESQKITERKAIAGTFDAAIAREESAKARIGGAPDDALRREKAADARIAFLREAKARRIRAVDSPALLTDEQRAAKELQVEREFTAGQANISLESQEAQLAAAKGPLTAARAAEAAARQRFTATRGGTPEERQRAVEELMFAQSGASAAEKQFGPTVAGLESSINQTRADAASADLLLRTLHENAVLQQRAAELAKQQGEALKAQNEAVERSIRDINSRSKTARD